VKQQLSEEAEELFSLYRKVVKKLRPKFKGRPTKRKRRQLEELKGKMM